MKRIVGFSLFVVFAACSYNSPGDAGVTLVSDAPTVLLLMCPGDEMKSVLLVESEDGLLGDEDDIVYWDLRRTDEAASPSRFEVGEVPPGFREVTPIQSPPPDAEVTLSILTEEEGYVVKDFRFDGLREGEVLADSGGPTTVEAFKMEARTDC